MNEPFKRSLMAALLTVSAIGCSGKVGSTSDNPSIPNDSQTPASRPVTRQSTGTALMSFELKSRAFVEGGSIPTKYTCEGADTSPPLEWSGAPAGARSFALIVDDPDAPDPAHPKRTYVHWVAYDIPASVTAIAEGAGKGAMPAGAKDGTNDWKKSGYGGPCPPIGRHRYFFKLSALDTTLALTSPSKEELLAAMKGHVLEEAQLVGTYEKTQK